MRSRFWRVRRILPLYAMFLPALVGLALFSFRPIWGIEVAFLDYKPLLGIGKSPFVGLAHFKTLFALPNTGVIFRNTLIIAIGKIVVGQLASLSLALLLHEVMVRWFKQLIQTLTYISNFLSWAVFGGIMLDILLSNGLVNRAITAVGLPAIPFLTNPKIFPVTLVFTDTWKGFGFGAILYLTALTGVDPTLYESAVVDGANRFQKLWNITLPGIMPMIILLACLSLGNTLEAGFDQVYMLQNSMVLGTGEVIDTFVYKVGLLGYQYSFATAMGLLKSVVSLILISLSYYLAGRFANYRIF